MSAIEADINTELAKKATNADLTALDGRVTTAEILNGAKETKAVLSSLSPLQKRNASRYGRGRSRRCGKPDCGCWRIWVWLRNGDFDAKITCKRSDGTFGTDFLSV